MDTPMSKRRPKKAGRSKNPVEARQRILAAAREQFSKHTFAGARIDTIAREAGFNQRMLYHYFGDKAGLYVAVLEAILGELRQAEMKFSVGTESPIDSILRMFDFTYEHFGSHPEAVSLMSGENLMRGEFIRGSVNIPNVSSPVLNQIGELLKRGEADGTIRKDIPPLHLYILMVGIAYFHRSNGYTLSAIFRQDVLAEDWQNEHHRLGREFLRSYIRSEGAR
ncbi:MAG: TetR family transcriptional regulator [Flavobacteriaceae bacterium]